LRPINAQAAKGRRRGKLTTGVVQIEIARRGDAWDKVATANAAALVALLGHKDRRLAATAKAFLTEKGKGAVGALVKGLAGNHAGVRAECARVLGRLRQEAQPAVTALAKALADTDPHVRVATANALGGIGQGAKAAVPALVRAVKEDGSNVLPSVRPPAAAALGWIGDARPQVVAALAELLKDKMLRHDANSYAAVAYALGRLGPAAASAVPVLAEQVQDKNNRQRRYALRSLTRIGPAATGALIRVLGDAKDGVDMRVEAAHALGRFGAAAKEALPVLEKVRNEHRNAPPGTKARLLFDAANSAIEAIRKAES
jgi:HEAT repeat protein